MNEREFIALADAELNRIEQMLERMLEQATWDYELKPGGVIELEFADGSKIVINRHAAAQEIWIAAKSGGFHFGPPAAGATEWRDTRAGTSLDATLLRCITAQSQ